MREDDNRVGSGADESDCIVSLSNFKKADEVVYPNGFHIGFFQRSRDAVDTIWERLRRDEHDVSSRKEFHGAWTFYFKAPGGFTIEVGYQHEMPVALSA
jgi:lactoylglutathione lyase